MNNIERYRAQLDRCMKPVIKAVRVEPKPLTGIEKQNQEDKEAREFWRKLESR